METFYQWLQSDNSTQIALIQRMAKKLGTSNEAATEEWIDTYSKNFRKLWNDGVRDFEELEDILYHETSEVSSAQNVWASTVEEIIKTQPILEAYQEDIY